MFPEAKTRRGGWHLRCAVCVPRRETVTLEPNTQTLTTYNPAEKRDEPTTLLLWRHLMDMGKLEGNPLPHWDPAPPPAAPGRRIQQCPRKALQGGFASLLLPRRPDSRMENKDSLCHYIPSISSLNSSGAQVIKCFSLEKGGVKEDLSTLFLADRNGPMQRPTNKQKKAITTLLQQEKSKITQKEWKKQKTEKHTLEIESFQNPRKQSSASQTTKKGVKEENTTREKAGRAKERHRGKKKRKL